MYNPRWEFQTLEQEFAEGLSGGVESQPLNGSLDTCNSMFHGPNHRDITLSLLEMQTYRGPNPVTAESESIFLKDLQVSYTHLSMRSPALDHISNR